MLFAILLAIIFTSLNACCPDWFTTTGAQSQAGFQRPANPENEAPYQPGDHQNREVPDDDQSSVSSNDLDDPQEEIQPTVTEQEMNAEIRSIIDGRQANIFPFTCSTPDELKARALSIIELELTNDSDQEHIRSKDVKNGDVLILIHVSLHPIFTIFAIAQLNNGLFRWINLDLEPARTELDSHKSAIRHYVEVNGLSIDPKFRIGHTVSPELAQELRAEHIPEYCSCRSFRDIWPDQFWDKMYTELILHNNSNSSHKFKFNPDRSIAYDSKEYELLSQNRYFFLAWQFDGKWKNIVLKLERNVFVKVYTGKDLSNDWKCTIRDLREFQGTVALNSQTLFELRVESYSGIATLERNYAIYLVSGNCFSDLPSNCCLDVSTSRGYGVRLGLRLTISDTREITWKQIQAFCRY